MADSFMTFLASQPAANLFAAFSAAFAAWAAIETRNATKAQLVSALIDEYGAEEMASSLDNLAKCKRGGGADFAAKWKMSYDAKDPAALAVNVARRHVKGFFLKADQLLPSP